MRWPREYWVSAIVVWSAVMLTALVMAVPYWVGGHTWLIHSGRVYPIMTVAVLGARVLYGRRYGSSAEIASRYDLTRRQKALGLLLLVAGLAPGIAVIVIVTAQAGVTNP